MKRLMVLTAILGAFALMPVAHAAPRLHAFLVPDRTIALLVIAALFYCGFKWRAR